MTAAPRIGRRIIYVPDDYRQPCELGWETFGEVHLDHGRAGAGQIWYLDSGDVITIPAPPMKV